jgi:hypothetical protein
MIAQWRVTLRRVDSDMRIKFHADVIKNRRARGWQYVSTKCRNYVSAVIKSFFTLRNIAFRCVKRDYKAAVATILQFRYFPLFYDKINLVVKSTISTFWVLYIYPFFSLLFASLFLISLCSRFCVSFVFVCVVFSYFLIRRQTLRLSH